MVGLAGRFKPLIPREFRLHGDVFNSPILCGFFEDGLFFADPHQILMKNGLTFSTSVLGPFHKGEENESTFGRR